jgi:selenocysteine-specific elongation factor
VRAHDRAVTLGPAEVARRTAIAERTRSSALQPPPIGDLISGLQLDETAARKILHLMIKDQTVVRITEDTVVDREALERLVADVRGWKGTTGRFGVKEFKDLTGLSRKFAMPLLEYLDAQHVTRRVGDQRVIL